MGSIGHEQTLSRGAVCLHWLQQLILFLQGWNFLLVSKLVRYHKLLWFCSTLYIVCWSVIRIKQLLPTLLLPFLLYVIWHSCNVCFLYVSHKLSQNFNLTVSISSHRPLDLDNIYNQDQVKLLMKEGEHLSVPDFDDIYADSEVSPAQKSLA